MKKGTIHLNNSIAAYLHEGKAVSLWIKNIRDNTNKIDTQIVV